MHIQRRAVVGQELGAHVEACVSIGSDQQPVTATGENLTFQAFAFERSARDFKKVPCSERPCTDFHRRFERRDVSEFVYQIHHWRSLVAASELSGCLPNSIQDKDEVSRMRDDFKHRDLFQNFEFAFGDRVTPEQRLI